MPEATPGPVGTCAHLPCSCAITARDAYRQGGELYCSQGCAQAAGCHHENCHCADDDEKTA